MASARIKAIEREKKVSDAGYVDARKGILNQKLLDELGIERVKVEEGTHFFAIVPPPDPESYFGQRIHVHYHVGAADDTYLCPLQMWRERCPICEERSRLAQAGEAVDKDYLYKLNPSMRYLFFIVDMKDKDSVAKGVQLWEAANSVNQGITDISKNKRTGELIDISDPVEGKTLEFERKGKGQYDTKYTGFKLEDREPLLDEWLAIVPDFKDILVHPTYEEMVASFFGEDGKAVIGERKKEEKKEEEKAPTRQRPTVSEKKEEPKPPVEEKKGPTPEEQAEIQKLMLEIDLTDPEKIAAFGAWKKNDGSLAGLKALVGKTEAPAPAAEKKAEPTPETPKEESKPASGGKSTIEEIRARLAARRASQK